MKKRAWGALTLFLFSFGNPRIAAATLDYSTYLGGQGYDGAFAVAVDAAGNAYVGGGTTSTSTFPTLNALQTRSGGGFSDGIVAKFDAEGRLLFSTYFGGIGFDYINAIALDLHGDIVIAGETRSTDLPTSEDAFQPNYNGGSAFGYGDGFIAKISADGSELLHCSYFGGSGDEKVNGLALDKTGNLIITGQTDSRNLPLKGALQPNFGGGESDGYLAKFDATLTNLVFSTYFGGANRDEDQKIAVDPSGYLYLSGRTLSTNFPVTPGAFQTDHLVVAEIGENWDGSVARVKPDGSSLIYSTYIGDATTDAVFAIAAGSDGSAYITGSISASWDSGRFPLGFQSDPGYGELDAFVARLKPDGSNFAWFSYLGGSGREEAFAIGLDKENSVFLTGITDSRNFPGTIDAPQQMLGGGQDSFVAKMSGDGKKLLYSTYLGGANEEWGCGLGVDTNGNVIAVGQSASLNFPLRNAVQSTNSSLRTVDNLADVYIVKLSSAIERPPIGIARSGKNVLITWPTNFHAFVLESSLSPAIGWTALGSTPITVGNQFAAVQPSSGAFQMFRLRRP